MKAHILFAVVLYVYFWIASYHLSAMVFQWATARYQTKALVLAFFVPAHMASWAMAYISLGLLLDRGLGFEIALFLGVLTSTLKTLKIASVSAKKS